MTLPQTREMASAEKDMFSVLHNSTKKELYDRLHNRVVYMAGNSIGFFLSGIAVTIGISSVLLLSSRKESLSRQDKVLRLYTVILLFFAVAYQIQTFLDTNFNTIFFFVSLDKGQKMYITSAQFLNVTLVAMICLADGLLVWRCFRVQRVLGCNSSAWGNILWIFPACLWSTTIAMAVAASLEDSNIWYSITGTSAFAANVTLNLYATLFITIRLLLHRRMVMACLGDSAVTSQHIYVVGILLESAAINVPVTIVAAVGIGTGRITLKVTMMPIVVASQVLASVLIIHQAALGRVFSQQRETDIKRLMEMRKHNIVEMRDRLSEGEIHPQSPK